MGCIMIPHKTSNGLDEFVGNSVKKKKKKTRKKKRKNELYITGFLYIQMFYAK